MASKQSRTECDAKCQAEELLSAAQTIAGDLDMDPELRRVASGSILQALDWLRLCRQCDGRSCLHQGRCAMPRA